MLSLYSSFWSLFFKFVFVCINASVAIPISLVVIPISLVTLANVSLSLTPYSVGCSFSCPGMLSLYPSFQSLLVKFGFDFINAS